jgi:hypothetical protein
MTTFTISNLVNTFELGERIQTVAELEGIPIGTAVVYAVRSGEIDIKIDEGSFTTSDSIIGLTSNATADIDTITNSDSYDRVQSQAEYYVDYNLGSDDNAGTVISYPAKTVNKVLNSITSSKEPSAEGRIIVYMLSDYDFNTNPVDLQSSFWYDVILIGTFTQTTTVTVVNTNSSIQVGSSWGIAPSVENQYTTSFYSSDSTAGNPILYHNLAGTNILGYITAGVGIKVNTPDYDIKLNNNFIFSNSSQAYSFNGKLIFDTFNIIDNSGADINISSTTYNNKESFLVFENVIFNLTACTSLDKIYEMNKCSFISNGTADNITVKGYIDDCAFRFTNTGTKNLIVDETKITNLSIFGATQAIKSKNFVECTNLTIKKISKLCYLHKNTELYIGGNVVLDKDVNTYYFTYLGDTEDNTLLQGNNISNLYYNDGGTTVTFQTSKGLKYGSDYSVIDSRNDIVSYTPVLNGFKPIGTDWYTFTIRGTCILGSNGLVPLIFPDDGKNLYKCAVKINLDSRSAGNDALSFDIKIGTDVGGAVTYGSISVPYGSTYATTNFDTTVMHTAITEGYQIYVLCSLAGSGNCEDITIDLEIK